MSSATQTRGVRLRRIIKALLFVIAAAIASPLIVLCWVEKRITRGETLFLLSNQLLAMLPGFIGRYLRGAFYFGALDRCSWETHIGFGSIFTHRGAIVGAQVSMGAYCVVGHAHIGDAVMMGSRVSVPSGKRQHLDEQGQLSSAGNRFETVTIGTGTWVGEGAIIMADVGTQCIVSAGAVVVKAMPDGWLVGGNPARAVKALNCADDDSGED